jgi:hypothetical protein
MDGIMFGMALAAAPSSRERRVAYEAALRADQEMLRTLPHETLETAITERRLWTLPGYVDGKTTEDMVEAISRCMRGKDRPLWLAALGLSG